MLILSINQSSYYFSFSLPAGNENTCRTHLRVQDTLLQLHGITIQQQSNQLQIVYVGRHVAAHESHKTGALVEPFSSPTIYVMIDYFTFYLSDKWSHPAPPCV